MLHHYLQLGFSHEFILNLSPIDKHFYNASMLLRIEEEKEKMKAMGIG